MVHIALMKMYWDLCLSHQHPLKMWEALVLQNAHLNEEVKWEGGVLRSHYASGKRSCKLVLLPLTAQAEERRPCKTDKVCTVQFLFFIHVRALQHYQTQCALLHVSHVPTRLFVCFCFFIFLKQNTRALTSFFYRCSSAHSSKEPTYTFADRY